MATALRRQYLEAKAEHPDAILFFRLGDFYETFDGDAEVVARELGIALTSRPMGEEGRVPLAGVPAAKAEQHVARLVEAGRRVAICEQLEEAGAGKGLVRRGVVRVVSPGAALEEGLLEAGRPNACAALLPLRAEAAGGGREWRIGLAAADLSTGAFAARELRAEPGARAGDGRSGAAGPPRELWERAAAELEREGARELLLAEGAPRPPADLRPALPQARERPARRFRPEAGEAALRAGWPELGAEPAAAAGFEGRPAALGAAGALLEYLGGALPAGEGGASALLEPPLAREPGGELGWDAAALRALSVAEAPPGAGAGASGPRTLIGAVDRCRTAAGRRRLRADLLAPLAEIGAIEARLDLVGALAADAGLRRRIGGRLALLPDLERLLARAAAGLARPPELAALARGLVEAAAIGRELAGEGPADALDGMLPDAPNGAPADAWARAFAEQPAPPALAEPDGGARGEAGGGGCAEARAESGAAALRRLAAGLAPAPEIAVEAAAALEEQPAAEFGGGVLRAGADAEADAARARARAAAERVEEIEEELRAESGLESLRTGRHRAFGWYLEASGGELSRGGGAPEGWRPLQSLRSSRRFTEPRLAEAGAAADAAEEELAAAERRGAERLRAGLAAAAGGIRARARAAARLDAARSLAEVAAERGWTRPLVDDSGRLEIRGGRHPIVEASLAPGGFAPNDAELDAGGEGAPQLLLVTGPNMAGKSTYLRQAALIAALAQAGSFVPAESARIGLVDRIYARVGAHDDLAAGRSTFLIEMLETARLLRGAGPRSLVLLDEIGRGTGTWDGLAIARAVAEALAGIGPGAADEIDGGEARPRTLFATHFLELTELAAETGRIANAAVRAEEDGRGGMRFLHKVEPGAADRSYGVQAAAAAGLPAAVTARAAELLAELERGRPAAGAEEPAAEEAGGCLPACAGPHPLAAELARMDVDGISPIEAINALYALKDRALRDEGAEATDGRVIEGAFERGGEARAG